MKYCLVLAALLLSPLGVWAKSPIPVTLEYRSSTAKSVEVTAEFTEWKRKPMTQNTRGHWTFQTKLVPGEYLYNFVVDGHSVMDPTNKKIRHYGDNKSNVLVVKPVLEKENSMWPVLGYVENGQIYIPVFGEFPKNPPKELWGNRGSEDVSDTRASITPLPLSFVGTGEISFTHQSALIYKAMSGMPLEKARFALVFGSPKKPAEGFRIVQLTSSEGIHNYVQTFRNGACIRSLDYYYGLGYDVESASEEEFKKARCGQTLTPAELPPFESFAGAAQ